MNGNVCAVLCCATLRCVCVCACVYNFLSTVLLFIDFSTFFPSPVQQTHTFLLAFMAYMCLLLPLFSISHTPSHTSEIIHSVIYLVRSRSSSLISHPFFSLSPHSYFVYISYFRLGYETGNTRIFCSVLLRCLCLCMLRDTPCFYACTVLC